MGISILFIIIEHRVDCRNVITWNRKTGVKISFMNESLKTDR